jgi:hypothetical protein
MKSIYKVALAMTLALATPLLYAADADEHQAHHPENAPAASPPKAPSKPANTAKATNEQSMKMDAQMKTMRQMHDKMMNAKTPEERKALMADHMKAMKDGMSMMSSMSGGGMMGGGMAGGSAKGNKPASPQAMQQQMDMMQKKTDMMQTMMQMMMDRMEMQMPAK